MKYFRLIPVVLLTAMLTSCNTTKRLYEAKEYDQVIQRLAPEICHGDRNVNRINMVAASYYKANQADHERIQALKASGHPDIWPEIYQRYCSMKGRNDALKCFPTRVKNGMNYVKLDLDEDMTIARNKAEAYLVAKANQLLNTGTKADAEMAGKYIEQLKNTNQENSQLLNLQLKQAMYIVDKVEFGVVSDYDLPNGFVETLFDFSADELPSGITQIYVSRNPSFACVVVDKLSVTPVRLDEVTFKESNGGKKVEVTDHTQNKTATISGTIEYFPTRAYRCYSVPFEVKSTFKNDYTTIKGDREACSAETLNRLNCKPVPVPTDESLLLDAAKKLNDLLAIELKK